MTEGMATMHSTLESGEQVTINVRRSETMHSALIGFSANDELTGHDVELAQIGLIPDEHRIHLDLFRIPEEIIASDVDAIHAAANAGNERAHALLKAAAFWTRRLVGEDADADPTLEDELSADLLNSYAKEPWTPEATTPAETIVLLDKSLGIIELAIEDAARDWALIDEDLKL